MIRQNGKCEVVICFLLKRLKFVFKYGGHVVLRIGTLDIIPMRSINKLVHSYGSTYMGMLLSFKADFSTNTRVPRSSNNDKRWGL